MGCVSVSERCFPEGRLSEKNFAKARLQVRLELEPVRSQFRKVAPVQVVGNSGSIRDGHRDAVMLASRTGGARSASRVDVPRTVRSTR